MMMMIKTRKKRRKNNNKKKKKKKIMYHAPKERQVCILRYLPTILNKRHCCRGSQKTQRVRPGMVIKLSTNMLIDLEELHASNSWRPPFALHILTPTQQCHCCSGMSEDQSGEAEFVDKTVCQ